MPTSALRTSISYYALTAQLDDSDSDSDMTLADEDADSIETSSSYDAVSESGHRRNQFSRRQIKVDATTDPSSLKRIARRAFRCPHSITPGLAATFSLHFISLHFGFPLLISINPVEVDVFPASTA
jgi:hypothetical protein